MLALQLKVVTTIEFQVWDYISGRNYYYFRCVPFELFLEHIAPSIRKNPRNVSIVYDSYYAPQDVDDREMVMPWFLHLHYSEIDPFADIDPMPIDMPVCRDWVGAIDATKLLGWGDQWWDLAEEVSEDMTE